MSKINTYMAGAGATIRQNTLSFIWSQVLTSHGPAWLGMSAVSLGTVVKYLVNTTPQKVNK